MADVPLPAPGEGKRGPDGHVAYLLRQAAHVVRGRIDDALADLDLTGPQFAVLTMIAAYPGCSGADLARLTRLTPQTVSFVVTRMVEADLLSRAAHPSHGRIRPLAPTERGRARLAAARERVAAIEAAMLAPLDEAEAAIVRRWLAGLASPDRDERSVHSPGA